MRKEVQFHYDREADVLYLSVGKPQKAKTIEIGEDFVLRLHPKNRQAVGMTIINFSKPLPPTATRAVRSSNERLV